MTSHRHGVRILHIAFLLFGALVYAGAAPLEFVPQRMVQPDGAVLLCYASGDEYYNWLHDAAGYTIVQDPSSGFYVFARPGPAGLRASTLRPGIDDPGVAGLIPWLKEDPARIEASREAVLTSVPGPRVCAPTTGTLNNLVVFIRFADDEEFTDLLSTYATMFNASTAGTNSLYNFFREASYGRISIVSTLYPSTAGLYTVAYQDTHQRGYFQPYNASTNPLGYQGGDDGTERRDREHRLLKNAVTAVGADVPPDLTVDGDGDGYVDNVCFIIQGSATGWSSLLWPHMWSLYSQTTAINGKRVWNYNIQLQKSTNASVLSHEMFHTLGAPDLYHYTSHPVTPIGSWDLMGSNTNPPQHMSAYMKWRYGKWVENVPAISLPGRYILKPVSSPTGNILRVNSPYSRKEFFILEYRKKNAVFEKGFPAEGLLIYRVDSTRSGNANGPPDGLYLYRPGGTATVNGTLARAAFSSESGQTALNDMTDPSPFLSTGRPGGLNISDVSRRGDTIAFTLGSPLPAVIDSLAASPLAGDSILLAWRASAQYHNHAFAVECSDRDSTGFVTIPSAGQPGGGTTDAPLSYASTVLRGTARYFRIRAMDSTGQVQCVSRAASFPLASAVTTMGRPSSWEFPPNYPNPFNPVTVMSFRVDRPARIRLTVVDLLGREVVTLFDGAAVPGTWYRAEFRGEGLPSGVYFATLRGGGRQETRRLLLMR
jgi:M6 family metalloprotease-like protein